MPEKSPALAAAEVARQRAREERAVASAALLAAIAAHQESPAKSSTDRRISALETAVAAKGEVVSRTDAQLIVARTVFAKAFAAGLLAPSNEAATMVEDLIEQLDDLLAPLADLAIFAESNRLPECPPVVRRAPGLRNLVFELRKVLRE